jgi:hypothetical protein
MKRPATPTIEPLFTGPPTAIDPAATVAIMLHELELSRIQATLAATPKIGGDRVLRDLSPLGR